MNLKGTVSSLPDSTGNLFVQMGIPRSKVNIRDIEMIREDDINATLGDGSSRSYGAVSGTGTSKSKKTFSQAKALIPAPDRSKCQNPSLFHRKSISSA